jgi:hypothetical protein
MRKNVTLGFSPEELMRLQGAAAVAGVPLATYVKWLVNGGSPADAVTRHMTAILERLDAISVGIAKLPPHASAQPQLPIQAPAPAPRESITARLRERGLPSSTIRQVNAVLDELQVLQ